MERPSLNQIAEAIDSVIDVKDPFHKKVCLYVSQEIGGYSLKEIGAYYGMRGPAVSQSNRRLKAHISRDKELKKIIVKIKKAVRSVES
jgi:hypothetical protein